MPMLEFTGVRIKIVSSYLVLGLFVIAASVVLTNMLPDVLTNISKLERCQPHLTIS